MGCSWWASCLWSDAPSRNPKKSYNLCDGRSMERRFTYGYHSRPSMTLPRWLVGLLAIGLAGCCNFPPLYADRQVWCWKLKRCVAERDCPPTGPATP